MHVSRRTALKVIYWNAVFAVIIVCLGAASFIRRIHLYDTLIVRVARQHEVDPRLISSIIWTESRFDPASVGEVGEIGLMQVTEAAGKEWAEAAGAEPFSKYDLFAPEINVQAGTWYLARAVSRWSHFSDPLPYALAEYNAGRANAKRWAESAGGDARKFWESITYPTTQRYVRKVLKRYRGGV